MKKKTVLIICLIIYLIIVFITEIFYREPLYRISVNYIKEIDQKGFPLYFNFFWSMIFLYGMMVIGTLIVLLNYPINIFFCNVSILITLIFIMCLFKSLYSSPRPYWDIYNQESQNENLIKYITLVLSIIFIICIMYSRINRQIHSFNQIIFGALLGVAVFFTFCYILEFDKISPKDFITILNNYKFILIPMMIALFSASIILGFTRHNSKEEEYAIILDKYCNYVRDQLFGKNTAFHSALIFIVIGEYIGLLLLNYKISQNYNDKDDIFYNWNTGSKLSTLKIALFFLILPAILPAIILIIPFKLYILKFIASIVFYFLFGFFNLGLCLYYGCILFNDNKNNLKVVSVEVINEV